jgi:undecaprenyl pyrophosphate phosphatase UppP
MSINDREYWSGSTKWTIHRNWQRMSHKTKNKNQTKTSKKRTQCVLDTIFFELIGVVLLQKIYRSLRSVWLILLVFCVLLLCVFTFHRNWQRMSHKTKNKNQTKTSKKRTQCVLDTIFRKQTQITLIRHVNVILFVLYHNCGLRLV